MSLSDDLTLSLTGPGMLPALEVDGQIVTESDEIMYVIEDICGPLYRSMDDRTVVPLRRLERNLFRYSGVSSMFSFYFISSCLNFPRLIVLPY